MASVNRLGHMHSYLCVLVNVMVDLDMCDECGHTHAHSQGEPHQSEPFRYS